MKELELLAPAGDLETLKAVIHAGADAVYLGGEHFGARAYANNFTKEELLEGIRFGHLHNRKIIMVVNTLLKNKELEQELYEYIKPYYEAGIDAVIVQDMGVVAVLQAFFPDLPLHSSTQMTVTNVAGAKLLKEQGFERIVTAREMSLTEIARIHEEADVEIESFIHGALCYCYSGQCLLSSMLGGRSGNRGRCAQPCRLPYTVIEKSGKRVSESDIPILSLKDLCTLPFLYELADSGVYSFKIEGRMKTPEYAAGVVSIYRKYMDAYLSDNQIRIDKKDLEFLADLGNRNGFTSGYYFDYNDTDMLTGATSNHSKNESGIQAFIKEQYVSKEIKEKINGKLILYKDSPAKIQITYRNFKVEVMGEVVMMARKQPLSKAVVDEKIRKTGNTAFVFDSLIINMQEDVFLPVNQLNQLRRDALDQLEELILAGGRREVNKSWQPTEQCINQNSRQEDMIVAIENRKQLSSVISYDWVNSVYLDSLCYSHENLIEDMKGDICSIKKSGKKAYYVFPTIFRAHTLAYYESIVKELATLDLDGYVIRSLDELGFIRAHKELGGEVIADSNLYTYSNRATDWFYHMGITRDTIPLELNQKEIRHRANTSSELIVYGRARLMCSAECIHKNTTGCNKTSEILELKDRYHISFPVRNNCTECYNIIYNSTPLCLFKEYEKLKSLVASGWRLEFTIEQSDEVEKVMRLCQNCLIEDNKNTDTAFLTDYTNGHFKRGVE